MYPTTFEFLLEEIAEQLQKRIADGNQIITPEKQLLVALWRMATLDLYRYELLYLYC